MILDIFKKENIYRKYSITNIVIKDNNIKYWKLNKIVWIKEELFWSFDFLYIVFDSSANSRNSSVSIGPDVTNPEETDIDDMRSLQSMQITLPQYCSLVLEKAVPLLKTGAEGVVTQLMYLLNQVLEILTSIVTMEIWQDVSSRAREIVRIGNIL